MSWSRQIANRPLKASRTALVTLFGLMTCGASAVAFGEIVVEKDKSDRAIVIASLDWQPTDPAGADWVAFRPDGNVASGSTASTGSRIKTKLDDAFDLFARSEPAQISDAKSFTLRTASLDPGDAWVPGARSVANDAAASSTVSAPVGSAAIDSHPVVQIGQIFPVPKTRPASLGVKVASLTAPTELPETESHARPLDAAPILGEPKRIPEGASAYLDIFRREASVNKIPLWLALGVAWVESKFDPKLRGTHTVVGMMQVMPSTAREMGYRGTTNQLFNPETNIVWGMKELAQDYQIAKGDICLTIAKYKGGFRTHTINKGAWNYCSQVKRVTGMTEVASVKQDKAKVASNTTPNP